RISPNEDSSLTMRLILRFAQNDSFKLSPVLCVSVVNRTSGRRLTTDFWILDSDFFSRHPFVGEDALKGGDGDLQHGVVWLAGGEALDSQARGENGPDDRPMVVRGAEANYFIGEAGDHRDERNARDDPLDQRRPTKKREDDEGHDDDDEEKCRSAAG